MRKSPLAIVAIAAAVVLGGHRVSHGQGYGTDTQNVLAPAAGGMAGVSIARPQDVPSAIFGNPATLSQFSGTQFCLGGAWVEGYPTVTNPTIPGSVTSRTEGFAAPEIGVTQDLRSVGVPGALGLGFGSLSGLGAEYRGMVPGSSFLNNLSSEYIVLGVNTALGVQLTDRLSAGAGLTLGNGMEQLGLTGPLVSSAMVNAYGLRGDFGLNYDLNPCNTVGAFYQTRLDFEFPNAVRINSTYNTLLVSQPETVGLGYANRALCDGNLLLAADVYYKMWDDAPLYKDIYINQWAFAVGAQLTRGKLKYRLGYSYNTNPLNHNAGSQLDGYPAGQAAVQLFQAASCATINEHRITGGIGYEGFLVPCLDLDLFAGGLLNAHDQFGVSGVSVDAYYVGMGLTWKFGAEPAEPAESE
jgi:long-chain fatty acid transport protein